MSVTRQSIKKKWRIEPFENHPVHNMKLLHLLLFIIFPLLDIQCTYTYKSSLSRTRSQRKRNITTISEVSICENRGRTRVLRSQGSDRKAATLIARYLLRTCNQLEEGGETLWCRRVFR